VAYWEKNILPKIYDYVKGSLKGYEIEDFFEQMRQPLRKGDQAKALEIAYIVCD
jgi:other hect domain ubiquitin protein ligase E3